MKKRNIVGVVSAVAILVAIIGGATQNTQTSTLDNSNALESNSSIQEPAKISKPTCDGTVVTSNCTADGIGYVTYTYQPAVAEKSHTETITTYRDEIASYCTLCDDGTYSPSCATGRGACSHHGGVAQWNAPRYRSVPEYTTKVVIDAPAQEAFYTKVAAE